MYVIVRADLTPGLQAAQACHAAIALCDRDGTAWLRHHPNLVVLSVADEAALARQTAALRAAGCDPVVFWEPDVSGATAAAVRPDVRARACLARLPLAGREVHLV